MLKAVPDSLFAVRMALVVVWKRLAIFQRESPFRTASRCAEGGHALALLFFEERLDAVVFRLEAYLFLTGILSFHPTWMVRLLFRRLVRMIDFTLVPYRRAMVERVSPFLTRCVTVPRLYLVRTRGGGGHQFGI